MKKIVLAIFLGLTIISTATIAATEVIQMDKIPVLEVNQSSTNKTTTETQTHVDSFIEPTKILNPTTRADFEVKKAGDTMMQPAEMNNPTINFNLGNIKNIKKGGILPKFNATMTVVDSTKYYNAPYDKVFSHLLGIVDKSELEIVSYDTATGRIFANYSGQKPVYITVSQYNSSTVMVKITPADGVYDLPATMINKIFTELSQSLSEK